MKNKPKAQDPSPKASDWLVLAWAGFVVFKYLETNPLHASVFASAWPIPTLMPSLSILLTYGHGVGLFLGVAAGSFTVGRLILGFIRLRWNSALEQFVFSVTAGYGILSLGILLLAALRFITPAFLFGVWAAGVAAFAFCFMRQSGFKECLA